MISRFFQDCIRKQKYGLAIYPSDLFDLRIQEEMIRADEHRSYFVYAEMFFSAVKDALVENEEEAFWDAVLRAFATNGRGSDVMGLLENESGIGIILHDSQMVGWNRLLGRFREFAKNSIADVEKPLGTAKALVYPMHINAQVSAKDPEELQ